MNVFRISFNGGVLEDYQWVTVRHSQGPPLPGFATSAPRVRHSQGSPFPGSTTPRVRHSQGPPLPGPSSYSASVQLLFQQMIIILINSNFYFHYHFLSIPLPCALTQCNDNSTLHFSKNSCMRIQLLAILYFSKNSCKVKPCS